MAFRLLRLLNLYLQQEEHCKMAYHTALAHEQQAAEKVQELEQELAVAGQGKGQVEGEKLRKFWTYRHFLGEQLDEARAALLAAKTATETAQAELLAARQQRKTLESLKDKHDAAERQAQARKEQVLLDEAGLRSVQV